ncbi:hypothetical protein CCH79_00010484 [Gambusia affinis]|uniref:Uncharacterized protein n=1 Tax=Gambusia affinis TaxID=33528 RepID=A0A315V0J0_GAMAF|nr:hypothetical protein CCH79_00010484 [Gambusia affinis]
MPVFCRNFMTSPRKLAYLSVLPHQQIPKSGQFLSTQVDSLVLTYPQDPQAGRRPHLSTVDLSIEAGIRRTSRCSKCQQAKSVVTMTDQEGEGWGGISIL